jgi:hypothetical protein
MYGKLAMTCFKYQLLGSHHIFECFPMGGYRASIMSHQTAPTPNYRQPSPLSAWEHNIHPFEKREA